MRLDHMTDDERISIHAPRKGERPASAYCVMCPPYFNPRSPQGGATFPPSFFTSAVAVFQSTLPARGSDFGAGGCLHGRPLFQSTLPARGSDHIGDAYVWGAQGISIHAPRKGERQRKSAFVCSISANLLNIIHCGTVTRAVSRRRIALFRLFSVRRSGVFMYAYASH